VEQNRHGKQLQFDRCRTLVQDSLAMLGRLSFPLALFAYPFYLLNRSPGKEGSHFDPKCNLFTPAEGKLVRFGAINACFTRYTLYVQSEALPLCPAAASCRRHLHAVTEVQKAAAARRPSGEAVSAAGASPLLPGWQVGPARRQPEHVQGCG